METEKQFRSERNGANWRLSLSIVLIEIVSIYTSSVCILHVDMNEQKSKQSLGVLYGIITHRVRVS